MRKGLSFSEAGKLGGIKSGKFQKDLKKKRVEEYNKNPKLCKFCKNSIGYDKRRNCFCNHSCAAAFNNKGIRRNGLNPGNCIQCGKRLKKNASKYCSARCMGIERKKETKNKIENGEYVYHQSIKKYLIEKRLHKCEICGNTEWRGSLIPIVMDHIDGNSENNDLLNLRLVCANCDAQLPTYKSKNKGNGRHARRKRYAAGKSY